MSILAAAQSTAQVVGYNGYSLLVLPGEDVAELTANADAVLDEVFVKPNLGYDEPSDVLLGAMAYYGIGYKCNLSEAGLAAWERTQAAFFDEMHSFEDALRMAAQWRDDLNAWWVEDVQPASEALFGSDFKDIVPAEDRKDWVGV